MFENHGTIVREGLWLYAGSVEARVRIRASEQRFGTGDCEDPPEIREDALVRCYYVEWDGSGVGLGSSASGSFDQQAEAEAEVERLSGGTVRWLG